MMVAYNFKKQFADDVESGRKQQTIRAGEPRCKPGDALQLYTGQRTKACRKLRDAVCEMTRAITMKANGTVKINGQTAHRSTVKELAEADGFESGQKMCAWFAETHGLPFTGHIVNW